MTDLSQLDHDGDGKPGGSLKRRKPSPAPMIRDVPDVAMASARVTKRGAGKISTGEHVPGEGDVYHESDDVISVPASEVAELEERGWIEAQ